MKRPKKKEEDEEVRGLCSLLTRRHALMIIGWEDASAAVSEKCNPFHFFFFTPPHPSLHTTFPSSLLIFSLVFLFPWRIMERHQRVASSLGGGSEHLRGRERNGWKGCIMLQHVTLAHVCGYSTATVFAFPVEFKMYYFCLLVVACLVYIYNGFH